MAKERDGNGKVEKGTPSLIYIYIFYMLYIFKYNVNVINKSGGIYLLYNIIKTICG